MESEVLLGGLKISFPYVPYGIQKAMLAKVAITLMNKEHTLVESPTGTGKTLVLLCGSLAWHRQSKKDQTPFISARMKKQIAADRIAKIMNRPCSCGRRPDKFDENSSIKKNSSSEEFSLKKDPVTIDIADDDDCQFGCKKAKLDDQPCKNCLAIQVEGDYNEEMGAENVRVKIGKIPRIYYGTRTHKQITQVIRELKKTCYKEDLKMCILGSRDRTCINDEVKDLPDRNDRCQELIKNKPGKKSEKNDSCQFYRDGNAMTSEFEQIYDYYHKDAFDIEDAVKFGQERSLCPYYGMRSIQDEADITFCPYNYLLDPNIRKAMNINLNNAVIIFDEAHNIEDICRDSASFVIGTQDIEEIVTTMQRAESNYLQGSMIREAYQFFRKTFSDIRNFLANFKFRDEEGKSTDCINRRIFSHQDMLNSLDVMGIGKNNLNDIKENFKALKGEEDDSNDKSKEDDTALNNQQIQYISQLVLTLDFMFAPNGKHCTDFRCIVSKHFQVQGPRGPLRNQNSETFNYQLSLLCMNSGIAFEKIHSLAWSVIVASGTLSPIDSLKTELGCQFSHVFEGSHVIADDRIFASILSQGPGRVELNCNFANSSRLDFQDEVGIIVRDVCSRVPNGVLVFFPSYDRMETLYQRWFNKGYIKDIQNSGKKLYREQKSFTAAKFESELQKYHLSARGRGALLFAVFRGKVSEGIDFADTAARAVITIGIPYPNIKEVTIGLKRDYNDLARRERPHLMTGGDWYASQAFRALNQALGRCVRHRDDWGAILMIDSRLRSVQSKNSISKWIRRVVTDSTDYTHVISTLEDFVSKRTSDS